MPVLRRLLLALVAGVVLSLAFEPVAVPWVIPFAIAARLVSLRGSTLRASLVPGAAFGVGFAFVERQKPQQALARPRAGRRRRGPRADEEAVSPPRESAAPGRPA